MKRRVRQPRAGVRLQEDHFHGPAEADMYFGDDRVHHRRSFPARVGRDSIASTRWMAHCGPLSVVGRGGLVWLLIGVGLAACGRLTWRDVGRLALAVLLARSLRIKAGSRLSSANGRRRHAGGACHRRSAVRRVVPSGHRGRTLRRRVRSRPTRAGRTRVLVALAIAIAYLPRVSRRPLSPGCHRRWPGRTRLRRPRVAGHTAVLGRGARQAARLRISRTAATRAEGWNGLLRNFIFGFSICRMSAGVAYPEMKST